MKRFFAKYISYASLKDDLIKMYSEEFTEQENWKELATFYQTPLGKKVIEKTPKLSAKGAQLGMERVQANQAELQKMIQDELRENPRQRYVSAFVYPRIKPSQPGEPPALAGGVTSRQLPRSRGRLVLTSPVETRRANASVSDVRLPAPLTASAPCCSLSASLV